jgi:hypothetical protein
MLWAAAIGFGLWNPLRGAEFSARHLLMAHRLGDPYRLALAFGAEATHLAHTEPAATGRADRMLELARQSALISRSEHAAAFVTAMRAITTFLAGRWRESKGFAETAIQSLRENCVNVSGDLQRTYVFLLSSRFLLGDMRDSAPGGLRLRDPAGPRRPGEGVERRARTERRRMGTTPGYGLPRPHVCGAL